MNIQEAEVKITRSQSEKGQWKLREEGGRLKLALLVWQLDFISLTKSLRLLPFLVLAIEQSG